jgi:hypothetical protein
MWATYGTEPDATFPFGYQKGTFLSVRQMQEKKPYRGGLFEAGHRYASIHCFTISLAAILLERFLKCTILIYIAMTHIHLCK